MPGLGKAPELLDFLAAVLFHSVKHDQKVEFSQAGISAIVPDLFCWRQQCFLANHSCCWKWSLALQRPLGFWMFSLNCCLTSRNWVSKFTQEQPCERRKTQPWGIEDVLLLPFDLQSFSGKHSLWDFTDYPIEGFFSGYLLLGHVSSSAPVFHSFTC